MPISEMSVLVLSPHVLQIRVPTPTLPPAFETNTYIVGDEKECFIVDFGSTDPTMTNRLTAMLKTRGLTNVVGIVATHYHRDHTQGIPFLQQEFACPVYVHELDLLNAAHEMGVDAGIDWLCTLPKRLTVSGLCIDILHTPGHTHGHVSLGLNSEKVVLVGDLIAGAGSVWVGPPDGHMTDYLRSLQTVEQLSYALAGPGHGPHIEDAPAVIRELIARRQQREMEIKLHITNGVNTLDSLLDAVYAGKVPQGALRVARKTIQAHIAHLLEQNEIVRRYDSKTGKFIYTVMMRL